MQTRFVTIYETKHVQDYFFCGVGQKMVMKLNNTCFNFAAFDLSRVVSSNFHGQNKEETKVSLYCGVCTGTLFNTKPIISTLMYLINELLA